METKKFNRRNFLKLSVVTAAGAALAACTPKPTEPTKQAEPAAQTHNITVAWHTGGEG